MKIITFVTALLLTTNLLFAQIINIPGDYPTIQQGINAANTGDTVLVQPGTYNEHLNFTGKEITVGSLFLTTQDTSYITQTVIEGSSSDTVVILFENDETINTILCGLKITIGMPNLRYGIYCINASPTLKYLEIDGTMNSSVFGGIYIDYSESVLDNIKIYSVNSNYNTLNVQNSNIALSKFEISDNSGRGIYCRNTNLVLEDGIIKNNSSGILCYLSDLFLSGVTIKYNRSSGISNSGSEIVFDTENRCNIYFNSSESGAGDLSSNTPINLVLDTFSVLVPTSYYASPLNNFIFDILNGKLEQLNADVFISPQGSDSNSGLIPNEPFKTIRHASMVLLSDSLHPRTIQLLEGTYSKASNDEMFPAVLFDYISLKGISPETVILDGEDSERLIYLKEGKNIAVSGMTVTNGFGIYCVKSHFEMEDIAVTNNSQFVGGGLWLENSTGSLKNIVFENNQVGLFGGGLFLGDSYAYIENTSITNNTAVSGGGIYLYNSNSDFNNVVIDNNLATDSSENGFGYGGGVYCDGSSPVFRNTLFTRNSAMYGGTVICCRGNSHPRLINSTITGNEQNCEWGVSYKYLITSDYGNHDTIDIINSIIYANDSCPTLIETPSNVSYSNIEKNYGIIWQGEGNINKDPKFVISGDHPYQINDYSPCIDAGTPDTSGLNLPELDLAGNPRFVNNRIDMGAYEWNMFVGLEDPVFNEPETAKVSIYPNPSTSTATLSGQFASGGNVNICIYNTSGTCLKSWEFANQQTSQQEFTLDMSDLPPGIYFLRLQAGNDVVTKKVVKVR